MFKKLYLLLGAAIVIAAALPAVSAAATGLTQGGVLVPTGKTITFTNTAPLVVTSTKTGNITCSTGSVMLEANLLQNSFSQVVTSEGGLTGVANCSTPSGLSANVRNIRVVNLTTSGGGTATTWWSFEIQLGGGAGVICHYEGQNMSATYKPTETAQGGNVLTITNGPLSVSPAACGTTAKLDASVKMGTAGTGTAVYLM